MFQTFWEEWLPSHPGHVYAESRGISSPAFPPLPFQKGGNEGKMPFHNIIKDIFMVYQYQIEKNLLQLYVHPETSEWYSINSVILFEVNIIVEQKQVYM